MLHFIVRKKGNYRVYVQDNLAQARCFQAYVVTPSNFPLHVSTIGIEAATIETDEIA